jgi:predicted Holliday junction resolvase-like endonuclease
MIYTVTILCLLVGALFIANIYRKQVKLLTFQIKEMQEGFEQEKVKIRADAKKRSSAVNWGKSIEHFVPFMTKFPIPAEDVVFLGMPIDYVGFTNTGSSTKCEIHFIEVKSGNAFLIQKQKNIKKAVEEGRVKWHEISVEGNREV